jgi:hypothetical protein
MREQDKTDPALFQRCDHLPDHIARGRVSFAAPFVGRSRRVQHGPEPMEIGDDDVLEPQRFQFVGHFLHVDGLGVLVDLADTNRGPVGMPEQ